MSKTNGKYTTGRNRRAPMWKRDERDMYERHQAGYCRHGVYVGGCGIDWMCGACESGEPEPTKAERKKWGNPTRKANYYLGRVLYFLKRHRWEEANEAFTQANRWSARVMHHCFGKHVFKAWLAYGRDNGKFKSEEAA